ncbi:MAG: DUF615 domain-containing protein [Desulfobulbus sp.]|nr:DUF615 domain-containing protein [Desulfobulbus sp.]
MQISRSEQKRRIKEIERLVEELITLPAHELRKTSLPEEIRESLLSAAHLPDKVKKREIKYLTRLIREYPLESLYELVSSRRGHKLKERQLVKTIDFYRQALISEALEQEKLCRSGGGDWTENWSSATIAQLQHTIPVIDPLTLSRLAYLFVRTRNPRYNREIFRYLRSMQELHNRNQQRSSVSGEA